MRRLIAAALVLAACAPRPDAEPEAATTTAAATVAPNVVHIKTTDFAFDAPDTIPAGLTTFHLMNEGPDWHHASLIRIEEGHTMDEAMEAFAAQEAPADGIKVIAAASDVCDEASAPTTRAGA